MIKLGCISKKYFLFLFLILLFLIFILNSCGIPEPFTYIVLPKLKYDQTLKFIWFVIENRETNFIGYEFYYSVRDNLNPVYFKCNVKIFINNSFVESLTTPKLLLNINNYNNIVQIYFNDIDSSTIVPEQNKIYVNIYDREFYPFTSSFYEGKKVYFLVKPYVLDNKGEVIKTLDALGTNIIEISL